ncbi:dTDP-D-glucose 4,6-dehydratase [Reticulibacter mediterranei]|uniref:dTDP-D-glucose 4,6-dehydratase n=1 Tax=Reticulibacter mediterranei TaxID=2778369 RepID=A0A8J3J465_9CHLR|nr:NAD(P)-dependent oxidoreductase [Reticulibacter mediterranei]GHO97411.1 dTDP-D-glucose 4,6-dehydratase [Reticulibacter mediterranei]GHP01237.1 dTDP-D-glucose 4,6-dehydratase [Reticulibacter mediterranei]
MKVLVAGASGALGTPLTQALIAGGHEVLGLARSPESMDHLTSLGVHPILANVMDRDDLLRAVSGVQADAVIHALTALKKTPLRHQDMSATDALHDVGTTNLLAAARKVGAHRFVAESMTMGYGYGDWGAQIMTEDCPFAPAGSSSQLERHVAGFRSLERQIWEATREGWIEGVSLRYGAFYAPGSLVPILALLRRRSLPLPNGGRAVTSWIYLEDAATATVAALERGRAGEAYNIVDDEPVRNKGFFAFLCQQAHLPEPFTLPAWMMRPLAPYATDFFATSMHVSNAKAARDLGWRPVVAPTYRQGIAQALEALKEQNNVKSSDKGTQRSLPPASR